MKKTVILVSFLVFNSVPVSGKTVLDRTWNFASSADVILSVKDTLSIGIHFPGAVPDDRLIGYCRFHITVTDSNAGARITGKTFVYRIQNDCGFNAFDHVLTLNFNYTGGLLTNRTKNPGKYTMYMDPYPVSKIHQWFQVDTSNFSVDTALGVVRVVYYHKKPVGNTISYAMRKVAIASTGYPFDYGLFMPDTSAAVRFIAQHRENTVHFSYSGQAFSLNGRKAGAFSSAVNQGSRFNSGCLVMTPDGNEAGEKTKCLIKIK